MVLIGDRGFAASGWFSPTLDFFFGLRTCGCLFSGDLCVSAPLEDFFLGDLRREAFVLVAIRGRGAKMALSSGKSSSDE